MNREKFFVHALVLYFFRQMFFNTHPDYTAEKNLFRHVSTRNAVNVMANELRLHFADVLDPFIDKKVIKVTPYAYWTVKVKKELEQIEKWMEDQKFRLSYTFTDYYVWADLDKTYQVGEHSVDYVKQQFQICKLRDFVILESCRFDCDKFRTDYTPEEVTQTRKKIRDLENQVSELKSTISEFRR